MCISNSGLRSASSAQRGISLVELIMFIVIISIAVAGILGVMSKVTGHSADALVQKQALAIAESLLEEIELQEFSKPVGGFAGPYTPANRASFDCVTDYNGFATTGVLAIDGSTAVAGLGNYNVSATVAPGALGNIPAASAVVITVTVTDPANQTTQATGYRVAY